MLEPYRVLDLTDVRGQIAGMILGNLGADVIRVEPPGGSDARRIGPFLKDGPEAERSLNFFAYNRNKRSLELDLETGEGRRQFLALVAGSDFVIDSGPEGSVSFESLRAANPRIVHVRVSAFGSDGPMADRPASDLTVAAVGGPVSLQGDPDRAPVRVSVPQTWRHAGAEAAVAALVGHARMRTTGEAVFADVSAQTAMAWTMLNATTAFAIQHEDFERAGATMQLGNATYSLVHDCADGHVTMLLTGTAMSSVADWVLEEGIVDEAWLAREDWADYDARYWRGEKVNVPNEEFLDQFSRFVAMHSKQTLLRRGLDCGATFAPVQTFDDLLEFEQLEARKYFDEVKLPNGERARVPGAFARSDGQPIAIRRPAPRLGEHTSEILDELREKPRACVVQSEPKRALPFEGLNVVDFSWAGVGPIAGKYLADHGANVVRVEWQNRPDPVRTSGPFMDGKTGWNRSHFYGEFNTSKRSLALDLKHDRAREVTERLLSWSDVVLESFTPGAAARAGIGYEAARAANPGVVMVSTCLMGQDGPFAKMWGYGYHAASIGGFYEVTGYSDRRPIGPWNAYTDTVAPRFIASTLLAALDHKRRTGEGRHIDVAQMETAIQFLAPEILARQANGQNYTRIGNRSLEAAPQGVYPCAGRDLWCAIAVEDDEQWRQLCAVMGDSDWFQGASSMELEARMAAHDEIDKRITSWTREREMDEIVETLASSGVPVAPVQRSSDLLVDPQLAHRDFFRYHEHAEMGRVPYSGHQFRISGYDSGPRSAAPTLGGHTIEVLSEELGFDDDLIGQLFVEGAVA